jgi:hypothetical protein
VGGDFVGVGFGVNCDFEFFFRRSRLSGELNF